MPLALFVISLVFSALIESAGFCQDFQLGLQHTALLKLEANCRLVILLLPMVHILLMIVVFSYRILRLKIWARKFKTNDAVS